MISPFVNRGGKGGNESSDEDESAENKKLKGQLNSKRISDAK
jgi:hypothetical protein